MRLLSILIFLAGYKLSAQQIKLGDSLFALGYYNKAIEQYSQSFESNKDFKLAIVYEALGNYEKLKEHLQIYILTDSLNPQANFLLGKTYYQTKDSKKAIAIFERLIEHYEYPQYVYFLGLSYEQNNDLLSSYKMYKRVISLNEFHLKANYKVALYDSKSNKYQSSINIIDKILNQYPNNTDFIYLKGKCLYDISDYKNALKSFERLIELYYTEKPVYENIALCYLKLKEYQKSIDTYEKIMLEFNEKDNAEYHFNIGINYGYLKNIKSAEKHFLKSKELKRVTFENEYYSIAVFNHDIGNFERALIYYRKTLQEEPNHFEACYQIAILIDKTSKDLKLKLKAFEDFKNQFADIDEEKSIYVDYRIRELKKEIHLKG